MYRKRKKGRRMVSISFIVTFLVLAGIYTVFYVSVIYPQTPVEHLPSNIPTYTSFWAKYVPAAASQFGFQNYTKVRFLNSSLPFQSTLLQLVKPVLFIKTPDVDFFLTTVLLVPNSTVDIAFLNVQSYLNFAGPIQAQAGTGEQFQNASLYNVATTANGQLTLGWLALIPGDRAVAFAAGMNPAKQALSLSLQTAASPSTQSILSRVDITQSFYIVGGVRDHVAVGGQNFPGVVRSGVMTVTSVDSKGPYLYVTNVVAYANSSAALSHYSEVRKGYLGAQKAVVYDNFVMAQEQDPLSKLGGDYRLVL